MPDLLGTQTHSVLPLLLQWQLESSALGAQALLSCCQAALGRSAGSRDTSSPVAPCEVNTLLYWTCYPKTEVTPQHSPHTCLLSASVFIISQMNLGCLILVVLAQSVTTQHYNLFSHLKKNRCLNVSIYLSVCLSVCLIAFSISSTTRKTLMSSFIYTTVITSFINTNHCLLFPQSSLKDLGGPSGNIQDVLGMFRGQDLL